MFENDLSHEKVKQIHQPREKRKAFSPNKRAKGLSTSLAEYIPTEDMPWNKKRVNHVMCRMGFGAHFSEINSLLDENPMALIDRLIDDALNAPMPEAPEWVDAKPPWNQGDEAILQYFEDNYFRYIEYQTDWTELMKAHPFREKMVLFWHNHFVTEIGKYEHAPMAYRYVTALRSHALGNFKTFVHDIGEEDAMLFYLDGVENRVGNPNENYARELLELFTMGIGNYTEDDVREMARALTGYWFNWNQLTAHFNVDLYDGGTKEFFGRKGRFNYSRTIDIIFKERTEEIARFICTKIYKCFVYETPNEVIINELAQLFINEGFELEPVIRTLLKSEHFFDADFLGAMIKSPVEYMLGMQIETGEDVAGDLRGWQPYQLFELGQFLLSPVNVAGWPGYRSWISTTTLPKRWNFTLANLYHNDDVYGIDPIAIAKGMTNAGDPYQLAYDLAEYMIAVDLPETERNQLPGILLAGIPDYEWDINNSGAYWRVLGLLAHLRQLPEYQLM